MSERNLDPSESEALECRIGINVGEVIHDRDDIYGDGVNIAARIQEKAPPGSRCVSNTVFDQISVGPELSFDDPGYRHFRNIEKPVHVYQKRPVDRYNIHPMRSIETRVQGQPLFDDAFEKKLITRGQCACGSIGIQVTQESLGTGFCHCRICRSSIGAPVFAWAAFPIEAVKFIGSKP